MSDNLSKNETKTKKKKRKAKQKFLKRILIFGWSLFIVLALTLVLVVMQENKKNLIYQVESGTEINTLVNDYLTALTSCDQAKLKDIVMDPTEYNDMTFTNTLAEIISGYNNVNCYSVPGATKDAKIVYIISEVTIKNVKSTPKDIFYLYVRDINGVLYIDNRIQDQETLDYIKKVDSSKDIDALYEMVDKDVIKCIDNDDDFKAFYEEYWK